MSYSEYASRGRNSALRYVLGFTLAVLMTIALGVVLTLALQFLHLLPADFAKDIQDATQPAKFYPMNGVLFGLLLAAFVLAIKLIHGKRFQDVIGAWTWRDFWRGLSAWIVVLVVAALIDFLLDPSGFRVAVNGETPELAALALAALAVQTFAEEFVFRGYLTQGLLLATGRTAPAALISGILFGAMHIPNGIPQAVSATVFGVVLAFIAIRTGGIAFTYGLHLANNVFAAVVLVSGGDAFRGSPGLFSQNTPQLMWWDVGVGAAGLVLVGFWITRSQRLDGRLPPAIRNAAEEIR